MSGDEDFVFKRKNFVVYLLLNVWLANIPGNVCLLYCSVKSERSVETRRGSNTVCSVC